jgi:hypothetical protein
MNSNILWIIIWLYDKLYFYWIDLFIIIMINIIIYFGEQQQYSFSGLSLYIFVAFCAWVTYCAIRYGYAVG